jgi:hypothetical protein
MDLILNNYFQIFPKMANNLSKEQKHASTQTPSLDDYFNQLAENQISQETRRDEITPPTSPPLPMPPPPPAPLWTPQTMKIHMDHLLQKLQEIDMKVTEPQIISIIGVQHLHPKENFHDSMWEERLHVLFFESKIPLFWILDAVPDEDEDDDDDPNDPNIVHLYALNHHVKKKIMDTLQQYLPTMYGNSVHIQ